MRSLWATFFLGSTIAIIHFAYANPGFDAQEKWPTLKRGVQEQGKGNYRSALKLFKHAYQEKDSRYPALVGIVTTYEKWGYQDDGIEFIQEAIADNPYDLDIRLFAGDKYFQYGMAPKAIQEYDLAEKLSSTDHRASYKKALVYKSQGHHDLAISYLTNVIGKTTTPNYQLLSERAQAYYQSGQFVEAEKDIRKAYEMKSTDPETAKNFSRILMAQKKYPEAETYARRCSELSPNNFDCLAVSGDAAAQQKKYTQAQAAYAAAVQLKPENAEVRFKLAEVYLGLKSPKEADFQFAQALRMSPNYQAVVKIWLPSMLERQDYAQASNVLKRFHEDNPKDLWSSSEYAKILAFTGNFSKAADVMYEAWRETKSPAAQMHYAHYLYASKDFKKSLSELKSIKDKNLPVAHNMGVVFWSMKQPENAMKQWSQVPQDATYYRKTQIIMGEASKFMDRTPTSQPKAGEGPADTNPQFQWELPTL